MNRLKYVIVLAAMTFPSVSLAQSASTYVSPIDRQNQMEMLKQNFNSHRQTLPQQGNAGKPMGQRLRELAVEGKKNNDKPATTTQ